MLDYLDFGSHRHNLNMTDIGRAGLSYLPDGSGFVPTGVGTGLSLTVVA